MGENFMMSVEGSNVILIKVKTNAEQQVYASQVRDQFGAIYFGKDTGNTVWYVVKQTSTLIGIQAEEISA